jgi:hypothetical protein
MENDTVEFIEKMSGRTKTVLLSFSRGKDSLASWLVLRKAGVRVVPFHMQMVPGLKFVDEYLDYCEDFFQEKIYRTLHPCLYFWLNTLVYQPPYTRQAIASCQLPKFSMDDVAAGVKRTAGIDPDEWHAIGTSANDSAQRRVTMERYRGFDDATKRCYPIWNMRKSEKIDLINEAGLKLPVDYEMFGRSWDGLDSWYIKPIKDRFPDDYEIIKKWFPLIEMEVARKEFRNAIH